MQRTAKSKVDAIAFLPLPIVLSPLLFLLTLCLSGHCVWAQVLLSPAFQEEKPAELPADQAAPQRLMTLHATGEPDPALRYRFWPAPGQRRNASPHPFLSRAMLLASQALVQDGNQNFVKSLVRISELPLDQLSSDETRQFLDQYATAALGQLSEVDRLMDTTYDLQLDERTLGDVVNLVLPEIQESRHLARLLQVQARLAIAEQRWDDAVDNIRTGFRLSEIVGESTHNLISKLVGFAIAGVMLSVVGEAIEQPGCPNLYWALAAVPTQQLYRFREVIEYEVSSVDRLLQISDFAPDSRVGSTAAREQLVSIARQVQELADLARYDSDEADAVHRLLAGLYVIAMTEPSRELLAASDASSPPAADLSGAEAVLLATQLRLLRTRDEWTKWILLPEELQIDVEDKLGTRQFTVPSADVVTLISGLFMPAVNATSTASRRIMQEHHLWMTVEALRMHAAQSSELPESLADLQPVPALPDSIARGPFEYDRTSATTATLKHAPRWGGDSDNVILIELNIHEAP